VLRTPRGRMLGDRGWRHLGLAPPAAAQGAQRDLLSGGGTDEDA
jgi:holliday junction DNA helicase RuvB